MTDEELSISDATLIAWLRKYNDDLLSITADRIELLATTCEQLVATNEVLVKYRDAYAEMERIATDALRKSEARAALKGTECPQ